MNRLGGVVVAGAAAVIALGGCALFDGPAGVIATETTITAGEGASDSTMAAGTIAVAHETTTTAGPGATVNSTTVFIVLGLVAVAFIMLLGVGFYMVAKLIDRIMVGLRNARLGNGEQRQTEKQDT